MPGISCAAIGLSLPALYGYQARDITMMLDDYNTLHDPQQSGLVPSRDNLVSLVTFPHPLPLSSCSYIHLDQLREMRKLVAGARPGDTFFFYCEIYSFFDGLSCTKLIYFERLWSWRTN